MFKSNHERRMRYSIRKFSVGVASVLVASFFMGSVVHATETNPSQAGKTTEVASSQPTTSTEDKLAAYKAELKKEVEETNLPKERKDAYKKQIEQVNDATKLE
ncbi:IgA-binding beta antigen [Streptococcus pneumoniae]|nr:IgA-binding beta antigen [Streptococcus pneumoniae]